MSTIAIGQDPSPQDDFLFNGEWWFPGSPDTKIGGTLRVAPGGLGHLSLFGRLGGQQNTIFGRSLDSGQITLSGVRLGSSNQSASGANTEDWTADTIFLGTHQQAGGEALWRTLSFQLSHLASWTEVEIEEDLEILNSAEGRYRHTLSAVSPPSISIALDSGHLELRWLSQSRSIGRQEHVVTLTPHFIFRSNELRPCGELIEEIGVPLMFLLNLATSETTRFGSIYLKQDDSDFEPPTELLGERWQHVGAEGRVSPAHRLMRFRDVQARFPQIVQTWITDFPPSKPALMQFYAPNYEERELLDDKFLRTARAFELWHRRNRVLPKRPKIQDKELLERVRQTIAPDDWESIRSFLEGKLRPTLAERLLAIVDEVGQPISGLLDRYKGGKSGFLSAVVKSRNHIAHGYAYEDFELSIAELIAATATLELAFEALMLRGLGFDEGRREAMLRRTGQWYQLTTGHLNPLHGSHRRAGTAHATPREGEASAD